MNTNDLLAIPKLFERCCEGDDIAWCELMKLLTPVILYVCRREGLTSEESMDILGETSFLLLRNISKIRDVSRLVGYVNRIATNEIYHFKRRRRLFQSAELGFAEDVPVTYSQTPVEDELANRKRTKTIQIVISNLNPREAHIIRALFFDLSEPKYTDIADQIGIPVSSIGTTRRRALLKLRELIEVDEIDSKAIG